MDRIALSEHDSRGWEILTITGEQLEVDVVPGLGGAIIALRHRERADSSLLWRTPWGLRARGALTGIGGDQDHAMEAYPGGWQSAFPHGGPGVEAYGTTWSQHGEAWHAPFDAELVGERLVLETRLVRSPFRVRREIALEGDRVRILESVSNEGGEPIDVMWGQHPAFGPPLLSQSTTVFTNARSATLVGDGSVAGTWPLAPTAEGGMIDLSRLPGPASGIRRMAYLSDFPGDRGLLGLRDHEQDIGVTLDWSLDPWPFAWYWLEAGGHRGFPFFSQAYVLGLEPFSAPPEGAVEPQSPLRIGAGETRIGDVALTVEIGQERADRT